MLLENMGRYTYLFATSSRVIGLEGGVYMVKCRIKKYFTSIENGFDLFKLSII